MRFIYSSLLIAAMAMVATNASAVNVDLTTVAAGTDCVAGAVTAGCTLELDIDVSNPAGDDVQSMGVSIVARDGNGDIVNFGDVATLVSSAGSPQLLFSFATFSGLPLSAAFVSQDATSGQDVLRAIQAVGPAPTAGDGSQDPARAGGNGGQISIVLELTGLIGDLTLSADTVFGDGIAGPGGVPVAFNPSGSVDISAVPEPGTALLMGLGLMGLAGAGRRNA